MSLRCQWNLPWCLHPAGHLHRSMIASDITTGVSPTPWHAGATLGSAPGGGRKLVLLHQLLVVTGADVQPRAKRRMCPQCNRKYGALGRRQPRRSSISPCSSGSRWKGTPAPFMATRSSGADGGGYWPFPRRTIRRSPRASRRAQCSSWSSREDVPWRSRSS